MVIQVPKLFDKDSFSSNKPIRDVVYEKLKKAIITGEIGSGERIIENEYAEKLNISRTPVREALRKLERDGLVEYILRKGIIVKTLSKEDIIEIYTIRKSLECLAMEYVLRNITDKDVKRIQGILVKADEAEEKHLVKEVFNASREFHTQLIKLSGMSRLKSMIDLLDEYIQRFTVINLSDDVRRNQAREEHELILKAIASRKLNDVIAIVSEHLDNSMNNCLKGF
jgi:DNA-binding GntR family transcriptional regulator